MKAGEATENPPFDKTPAIRKMSARAAPPGWRWVRLGEVCTFKHGGTPSKDQPAYWQGDIPWVSPKDMRGPLISDTQDHVSNDAIENSAASLASSGTVLIVVRSGILARTVPIAIAQREVSFNQDIKAIVPDASRLEAPYLYFALKQTEPLLLADGIKKGATVHSIKSGFIESLEIPLPPLAEQKRIAARLNVQITAVEKARAAAKTQLDDAKALPATYLRQVFPQPGQELPPGWRWVRLGEVATLLPSKSIASDGDAEVQAVTTASLTEAGFNAYGIKTARMWSADVQECVLTAGEILIARSNTPELVGRASLFPGSDNDVVASDLTIRVKTGERFVSEFGAGYFSAIFATGYWCRHAGGASGSMKKITRTQVQELPVPIAPLAEQRRIAARLNEQMAGAERLMAGVKAQLREIDALPAALLRRAFNG